MRINWYKFCRSIVLLGLVMGGAYFGITHTTEQQLQNNCKTLMPIVATATPTPTPLHTVIPTSSPSYFPIPMSHQVQDIVFELAKKYDFDPALIIAIVDHETGGTFDINAKHKNSNGTWDYGLMQLNSKNNKWFSEMTGYKPFKPLNPRHNLTAGVMYLHGLRLSYNNRSKDLETIWILNSYNMGTGGYKKYIKRTGQVSRSYDRRVRDKYKSYKRAE